MKNVLITGVCLLLLVPGVVWIHSALPAGVRQHIPATGFNGELHVFWDAQPYAKGIDDYVAGRDPYPRDDPADILPFAYPPAFLWVGGALARVLPPHWGWDAYMAVNLASVVLVQAVLSFLFLRRLSRPEAWALLAFAPLCLFLTTVFWSGNIHLVWYFAALLAALPGVARNRWLWFYAVALLGAVNQPVFLLMLLLPFFAGARQLLPCVLDVVLVLVSYIGERALDPALYKAFQASVAEHLQASHDFGEGLFGICATALSGRLAAAIQVAFAAQIAFSAGTFFLLLYLRPRAGSGADAGRLTWLALLATAIVLVNPRTMPYDAAIGLIPACYLLVSGIRFRPDAADIARWSIIGLTVAGSVVLHNRVGCFLLPLAGFAAGLRSILASENGASAPAGAD